MADNTIKTIYDSGDRRLVTAADFGMGLQGLKEYTDQKVGSGAKITVDKELSSTSENPVANKAIKEALDAVSLRSAGNTVYAFNTDSSNPVGTGGIVEKEEYTDSSDESKNGIIYTLPSEYTKNGVPNILIDRCREETLPKNVYIKFPEEYVISDMKITVTLWDDYNTWVAFNADMGQNVTTALQNVEMTEDGYINLNALYLSHVNSYSNFANTVPDILTIFITGLTDRGFGFGNMAALPMLDNSVTHGSKYPVPATDADSGFKHWDFGSLNASKPTTFASVDSIKLYKAQYNEYLNEMKDTAFNYECIVVDKDKTFKVGEDITNLISEDFKKKNEDNYNVANAIGLNIIRLGDNNTVKMTGAFAYIDIDFNNHNKHIYKIFATTSRYYEKTGDTLAEGAPYDMACTKCYYNNNIPSDAGSSENENTYYLHIVKSSSLYVYDRNIDTYLPVVQSDDNEYPTATDADTLTTSIFNVPSKS